MKSVMFTSVAALLIAGAAHAAEIQVVERPGSDVDVVFTDLGVIAPTAPLTGSFDSDFEGMMSADVVTGDLPPGFEADALIYIWEDENGGMRVTSPMPMN